MMYLDYKIRFKIRATPRDLESRVAVDCQGRKNSNRCHAWLSEAGNVTIARMDQENGAESWTALLQAKMQKLQDRGIGEELP